MDTLDKNLLNVLQSSFPLSLMPFAELGSVLGIEESEVISRIDKLKQDMIIRNIGPIFDSHSLGYTSTLVAFKVQPEKLESTAAAVSEHPGVSHNYSRNDEFNLWFTLTIPPGADLDQEIDLLSKKVCPEEILNLPALQTFKLNVLFNIGDNHIINNNVKKSKTPKKNPPLSNIDKLIINEVQKDLSLISRPFDQMAEKIGMDVNEFISQYRSLKERGILRRFGASIKHRNVGFNANAMICWRVPLAKIDEAGRTMAGFQEVSHCYERKTYINWPYNIFTMIHGKTREECLDVASRISELTNIKEYKALFSDKEFKKVRVQYKLP